MNAEELLAAVHPLAWIETGELHCREPGHATGHTCLVVSDGTSLSALLKEFSTWYGQARALVVDGHADPAVNERSGLPLLEPFGNRLVEIHAWACRGRWIGCGTTRAGTDIRPVLLVAERADPAANGLPEGASWVDRIVAVTGWDAAPTHPVDWAAVENRLRTPLPGDYKRLAELFGYGAFDHFLQLSVPNPDARFPSSDIVRHTARLAQWAKEHGSRPWEPYDLFPAPGGLLQWADTEQAHKFYWLTEGTDPDKWPIMSTEHDPCAWERFDGSTAEFVYRMLTDPLFPFSTAAYFDVHWFVPIQGCEGLAPEDG
jgi:hypothetical protein